jgi:hypothetical protein
MINILKKNDFFNNEIEKQNFMNFIMNGLKLFKRNYKQYFEDDYLFKNHIIVLDDDYVDINL